MTTRIDLPAAEERARRALDGMSYNRDAMARDVIGMAAELRAYIVETERLRQQAKDRAQKATSSGFEDLSDIFGKRK